LYEIDFLPVGEEGQSGDAIALRFTRPDTGGLARVIVDAGFQPDGVALVNHVKTWFETDEVDLAILTHPDADHIGGMGEFVRGLKVKQLWLHRLSAHGGSSLPASSAVEDLIRTAQGEGTEVSEVFEGVSEFGGALTILGPDPAYYDQLVLEQVEEEHTGRGAGRASGRVRATVSGMTDRFLSYMPVEVRFDDRGGTNPRNNSSMVTLVEIGAHRALLTADAGVPALDRALDYLESSGREVRAPDFVQIPHAGSRHNASSDLLDRMIGPTGQAEVRTAFVSVASKAKRHPAARVVNAYIRRGCGVYETRGGTKHHYGDGAPDRGWLPATRLEPMDESGDD
jgi:beta-lactamase superfamily II metal-dependent hydrolase